MAASVDFSKMNHLLGDNEYDADMNIVETMVRAHNEPDNVWAQASLFHYYISRIYDYWILTKIYVNSQDIKRDIQVYPFSDYGKYSDDGISEELLFDFEQQLLERIESLTTEFSKTSKVDIVETKKAFKFIASVACLADPNSKDFYAKHRADGHMYPLPNSIGLFGFNTYLYALFEDVLIIGVPNRLAYFDKVYGCPRKFMDHDIQHSDTLYINMIRDQSSIKIFYKNLYYKILNDEQLSQDKKKWFVVTLWIILHEFTTDEVFLSITSKTAKIWDDRIYSFLQAEALEFYDIYDKFANLILAEDNVSSYSAGVTEMIDSIDKTDRQLERYAFFWKNQQRQLLNKIKSFDDVSREDRMKVYLVLSFWSLASYAN